jgi:hypothetical protein
MAMNAGNAACTTGLSKRMYDNWTGDAANNALGVIVAGSTQDKAIKSMCFQFASAVVAEIQANATVTVKTTDGGLQTDSLSAVTTAPPVNATLPGGCIH